MSVLRKSGLKKPALEFALISLFLKKLDAGPVQEGNLMSDMSLVSATVKQIQEHGYTFRRLWVLPATGLSPACKYLLIGGPAPYWCAQDIIVSVTIIAPPDLTSYIYTAI